MRFVDVGFISSLNIFDIFFSLIIVDILLVLWQWICFEVSISSPKDGKV